MTLLIALARAKINLRLKGKKVNAMKKLTLKEARPPYNISLDDAVLTDDEVVLLEKDGQPVAALVPMDEYADFQAWREAEKRRQARQAEEAAIEREHAAFKRMLPELLKQYEGRVVAIYEGQVVDVGDDRMEVWERARQQLGKVPVYVQTVEYPPRVYKVPHRKVIVDVEL
jgi:PHD/YefM family antitoxin component YafN of YafNO toxin-antitoxin module